VGSVAGVVDDKGVMLLAIIVPVGRPLVSATGVGAIVAEAVSVSIDKRGTCMVETWFRDLVTYGRTSKTSIPIDNKSWTWPCSRKGASRLVIVDYIIK